MDFVWLSIIVHRWHLSWMSRMTFGDFKLESLAVGAFRKMRGDFGRKLGKDFNE